jgi:hypothetical protein
MSERLDSRSLGGASAEGLKAASIDLSCGVVDARNIPWDEGWLDAFENWKVLCSNKAIVLLFSETARVDAVAAGVDMNTRIFQFGLQSAPPAGVYLVGRTREGNAWRLPNTGTTYQADCETVVADTTLRSRPAIVIGPSGDRVLSLPSGVHGSDEGGLLLQARQEKSALDDENLTTELLHFSVEVLPQNEVRRRVWEKSDKYWPIELAEKTIQTFLLIALQQTFKPNVFYSEVPTKSGNIDILVMSRDSREPGRSVLELKVARQFGSTGITRSLQQEKEWLMAGVTQAETYDLGATHKYLCAFDMRKDRGQECSKANVKFRHYVVPNSALAVRTSMTATI